MSEFMSYDPWAEITTRNGYAGDEMVAMLQKAIRRGKEEDALHAAYEMYTASPQFEEKLWRRLLCISVEDIGFGNRFFGKISMFYVSYIMLFTIYFIFLRHLQLIGSYKMKSRVEVAHGH